MASENPAKLLGMGDSFGRVEVGRRADLLIFRWDEAAETVEVLATV
jgi:N-acetylglucosamine-6-phosphate deacetylase